MASRTLLGVQEGPVTHNRQTREPVAGSSDSYKDAKANGPTVRLYLGSDALNSSSLTPTGSWVEAPAVTLAEILEAHAFDCCGLICDIEGAELSLIRAELAAFQSKVEIFIVEFHPAIYGWDALDAACRLLMEHGFDAVWQRDNTVAFKNTALTQGRFQRAALVGAAGHRPEELGSRHSGLPIWRRGSVTPPPIAKKSQSQAD